MNSNRASNFFDPGQARPLSGSRISEKGVHMYKGVGASFADNKYPIKMK